MKRQVLSQEEWIEAWLECKDRARTSRWLATQHEIEMNGQMIQYQKLKKCRFRDAFFERMCDEYEE